MIKTIVKETTGEKRRLPFVGEAGLDVAGFQTVVLDGAYPYCCATPAQRENFGNEVKYNGIQVMYASDMPMVSLSDLDRLLRTDAENEQKKERKKKQLNHVQEVLEQISQTENTIQKEMIVVVPEALKHTDYTPEIVEAPVNYTEDAPFTAILKQTSQQTEQMPVKIEQPPVIDVLRKPRRRRKRK